MKHVGSVRFGLVVLIMIVALTWSCSKTHTSLDAPIVTVWEPESFSTSYAMSAVNYYNGTVIYPQILTNSGGFCFADLSGKTIRQISIANGKGPGEIQSHMAITIANDRIVIYDNAQNKLVLYSIEGKHIDDIALNDEIGVPMSVTINDAFMYINGKFGVKLLKYDLTRLSVSESQAYEVLQKEVPQDGDPFQGGVLSYDPFEKSLFLGYYNRPFTLEQYDIDLNVIQTYSLKSTSDYKECSWYNYNGAITQVGDRVIGGIAFDENYIYTSFGGGYEKASTPTDGKPFEYRVVDVDIRAFDRKTKRQTAQIICTQLNGIRGFVKILGVTHDNIIIQIADMSPTTYLLMNKKRAENQTRNFAIAVLKNPLYEKGVRL